MRKGLIAAGLTGLALLAAAPAWAQDKTQDDIVKGAQAPLRDLGIEEEKIPQVLLLAASAPYSSEGTANCAQIRAQIDAITGELGADADTPSAKKGEGAAAAAAASRAAVGSFIPGFGLVRVVSGADKAQKRAAAAVFGASLRRAYLKGLGASKRCSPPAAPMAAAQAAKPELPAVEEKK